jgi:hypothetical protein
LASQIALAGAAVATGKSKRKRKPGSKKAADKPFLIRLRDAFTRLFKAPAEEVRRRRAKRVIREIKAKGYSPSYEKRLLRAVESGKAQSLQQARGHRAGEARRRAEREIEEQGISSAQIRSIRAFYQRWNTGGGKEKAVSLDEMIEYAQAGGYERFQRYRKAWTDMRRDYVRQTERGTYIPRPDLDDLMDEEFDLDVPEPEFLFYH